MFISMVGFPGFLLSKTQSKSKSFTNNFFVKTKKKYLNNFFLKSATQFFANFNREFFMQVIVPYL